MSHLAQVGRPGRHVEALRERPKALVVVCPCELKLNRRKPSLFEGALELIDRSDDLIEPRRISVHSDTFMNCETSSAMRAVRGM